MPRILVVEDDHRFRETVANSLVYRGCRVKTAASGPEAIEIGSLYRPETLVVDWNLNGRLNGLEVARALRIVCPELQVIMMTGFLSHDLEDEAVGLSAVRSIQKPFPLDALYDAIRDAQMNRLPSDHELELPVFEIDSSSNILYQNREAARLMAESAEGTQCQRLAELFLDAPVLDLKSAELDWLDFVAACALPAFLSMTARPLPNADRWLVVLHREDQSFVRRLPEVDALLGKREPPRASALSHMHVLVGEQHPFLRHALKVRLHAAGAVCHTANDQVEALDLFLRDTDINVVIFDFDLPGGALVDLIATLVKERPGTMLVGTSTENRLREFARLGVPHFIQKPFDWPLLIETVLAA